MRPIPRDPETVAVTEVAAATEEQGEWVAVCAVSDLEEEDVISLDHEGQTYAIYRLRGDRFLRHRRGSVPMNLPILPTVW